MSVLVFLYSCYNHLNFVTASKLFNSWFFSSISAIPSVILNSFRVSSKYQSCYTCFRWLLSSWIIVSTAIPPLLNCILHCETHLSISQPQPGITGLILSSHFNISFQYPRPASRTKFICKKYFFPFLSCNIAESALHLNSHRNLKAWSTCLSSLQFRQKFSGSSDISLH